MKLADRVLALLADHPGGLSDAEVASALGVVHQRVNACCRTLAVNGRIVRDVAAKPIRNRLPDSAARPRGRRRATVPAQAVVEVDRRERSVQSRVATWLAAEGWDLLRLADTTSRERGTDVVAERGGTVLHVEAKGYPSTSYADPRRAHEVKPTQPSTQARHWFAAAVLKALQLRQEHPGDQVALAFPDVPTYRSLLRSVDTTLVTTRVSVFFVGDDGHVEAWWNPA